MSFLLSYIDEIESGRIIAGNELKSVLNALKRDLDNPHYIYDERPGQIRIEFIERFCKHTKSPLPKCDSSWFGVALRSNWPTVRILPILINWAFLLLIDYLHINKKVLLSSTVLYSHKLLTWKTCEPSPFSLPMGYKLAPLFNHSGLN